MKAFQFLQKWCLGERQPTLWIKVVNPMPVCIPNYTLPGNNCSLEKANKAFSKKQLAEFNKN
jgi:hypothetical protein